VSEWGCNACFWFHWFLLLQDTLQSRVLAKLFLCESLQALQLAARP